MTESLAYYAEQGPISDPKTAAAFLHDLPGSIAELAALVRNLTIHVFWAERYGLSIPAERMGELQLRTAERRLLRTLELDPRPLVEPRSIDKKLIGNCRDHTLLLVTFLRHKGIPARARCGFGAYFIPGHFEDHWVAEYWDAGAERWVLVDAQLDLLQCEVLKVGFDPLDVPRDQFIVGGRAWQMCRTGEQDPDAFGIFDMKGLGFVRGNLVRDVAALNKVELLPWDCWGVILHETLDDAGDLRALDEVAGWSAGADVAYSALRQAYLSDKRLRVGDGLVSYIDGQMVAVPLDSDK